MGGMTRLKGMGMFMAATWLGPALIMPIWSWVWKYMFEGRPVRHNMSGRRHTAHRARGNVCLVLALLSVPASPAARRQQSPAAGPHNTSSPPRQPPEAGLWE